MLGLLSAPYDSCHSGLLGGGAGALLSLLLTLIGLKVREGGGAKGEGGRWTEDGGWGGTEGGEGLKVRGGAE